VGVGWIPSVRGAVGAVVGPDVSTVFDPPLQPAEIQKNSKKTAHMATMTLQ